MIVGVTPTDAPELSAIEKRLGHSFADRSLLLTALTHRSFSHESPEKVADNESLEFLGDAVLGFLIADRLFRRFPGLDEGRLSKHKAMIEKSVTLAAAAAELGLGSFLRLGRGECRSGGAQNVKILANSYEAVLAAIYLDGGLEPTGAFVDRTLGGPIAELDPENPINDWKSALQELTQGEGIGTPAYEVFDEVGPDHDKRFHVRVLLEGRVLGEGEGFTKRGAQQVAAKIGLELLKSERSETPDTEPS
jgi:ribonuclease-3